MLANISWRKCDEILKEIDCLFAQSCQSNLREYLNGNKDIFECDRRCGKQIGSFYEVYPDLKIIAKEFVACEYTKKQSNFNALNLANFIHQKFFELSRL